MINVTRSSMPGFAEYCDEIKDLWETRWLTNMGVKHRELQALLEAYLSSSHVTLYTNGHLALESALAAFHFPVGGEVITTPFTFVSTTHAITRNGLMPVFADIKSDDYTIDPDSVERLITEKTVAIVPVHVYGNVCDVERLQNIAGKYRLKLIYDAAHAFGVEYHGISAANFGDVSMFSFHATKVFNTIEGGALCYSDDALVQLLNDLKNFGIQNPDDIEYIGSNAKMSEFQAAMGICNLRHLDEELSKRKGVYERYVSRLSSVDGITLCYPKEGVKPNYAYFPVVFDDYKYTRDEVADKLKSEGVAARKYFYPLTNDCVAYRDFSTAGAEKTPVAKYVADRVLTLPLYADLDATDVDRICDVILK